MNRSLLNKMWSIACELPSKSYVYCSLKGSVSMSVLSNEGVPLRIFRVSENWKSFRSPNTTTSAFGSAVTMLLTKSCTICAC